MNLKSITVLRLKNQLLANHELKTPGEVVSWMGAIQSQEYTMGKWGIGVRLPGITNKQVEEVLNNGDFIRTHILRPTWHFVSRDDIHWMLQLSAPRLKSATKSYNKDLGMSEDMILKMSLSISDILEKETNLTRQEIADRLTDKGLIFDSQWLNYILFIAEQDGIVCNGIVKGKKQTYDLLENKVPKPDFFDKDEALHKLAYKYFRSHGPATLDDFAWWSGLTMGDARKAVESIKSHFIFETMEGQTYIFHESCVGYKLDSDVVHFLPAFDETFVSYKDRKEILALDHHKKVIVSNGVFKPTISKNGEIIGIWNRLSGRKKNVAEPSLFSEPSKKLSALIKKASNDFDAFIS